ncbi:PQQ-binding-like beta-propeller repeat protein [Halopelagius longus]|nr:PQQ-binding-like beta-propeller repeat protein [Halopelagius longus]SDQ15057.1 Outer membrane protein assembly factor BamB, contains PQQ-like beta-propeller repeat [Halopelagius longus]
MPSNTSRRRFLAAVGAATTASLAGCFDSVEELDGDLGDGGQVPDDATTDWPLPHFDAQATSYNPNPVGPREKPSVRWDVEGGWPTGRIAVVGDTAYVPLADSLRALDTASGEEKWRVGTREDTDANYGSPQFTSPAVVDGTVYVGTTDRRGLLALDAASGEERWRWNPGEADVHAPAVPVDDGIAAGTQGGLVAALAPETGEERWTVEVFGEVSRLAYSPSTLYAGTTGGEVYSFSDYDGNGLWRRKLGGAIEALAVEGSSSVYAGTFGGGVYHLSGSLHAGRTRWHAADGPTAHGALALADGIVVGTDLSRARGLHYRTGEVRWEIEGDFGAPPAASGSVGYLAGDDVVAVNLDGGYGLGDVRFGAKRWTFPVEGYVEHGVTVADGALFFAAKGGKSERTEGAEPRIYALE